MVQGTMNRVVDWVAHDAKAAAKALYRRPVIGAARMWREVLGGTCFIGVTGSAAKTTTKELLHAMLANCAPSMKNTDSNNQLYSVARTLIGARPGIRFCVQELGASKPGGLEPMLALLRPRVGVITTIGTDHFTAFRTREAVAHEKGTLVAALPADGLAVLNADDDLVAPMASLSRARVVTFGLHRPADFQGTLLRSCWPRRLTLRIEHGGSSVELATRLCGDYQSVAVLAATAAACSLGMSMAEAARAAAAFEPLLGRMSVHRTGQEVTFIRDDWKAPRWSLPAAFGFMNDAVASRKLIVLGTLSDSGGGAGRKYRRSVLDALEAADHVIGIGERAVSLAGRLDSPSDLRFHAFQSVEDASTWLRGFAQPGDLVLLKGSNVADHLARIALAADHAVSCWRRRCGRGIFCDHCRLLDSSAEEMMD